MEISFDATSERECNICFFDSHLSAAGCSPDRCACLGHAKQFCSCSRESSFNVTRYHLLFIDLSFVCSLGLNGSSNLCNSTLQCNVCSVIKLSFKASGGDGILKTATSGKAHDKASVSNDDSDDKRTMLVCRVIAGRVKNKEGSMEEYDSVAGTVGAYSNLDELQPTNYFAFVVIYGGF